MIRKVRLLPVVKSVRHKRVLESIGPTARNTVGASVTDYVITCPGEAGDGAACEWVAACSRTEICRALLSGLPALVVLQWRWRCCNSFHEIKYTGPCSECFRNGLLGFF